MAIPTAELQKINPSSIIELFQLELRAAIHGVDFTYHFHNGTNSFNSNGNIIWDGDTYSAFPIEVDGFEYQAQGPLPRPKIRVANLLSSITEILLEVNTSTPGNDLTGAKLTRIRTLVRYIDDENFPNDSSGNPYGTADTTAKFPDEIYYVSRKTTENRDMVEFELAAVFDLAGVRAPKRSCTANLCPWVYKGTECGYSGSTYYDENDKKVDNVDDDKCGKKLSSCKVRFGDSNPLPFGAFPGIGAFNG